MCGRFTLTVHHISDVAEQIAAMDCGFDELQLDDDVEHRPRFNVAPGQTHWIARVKDEQLRITAASWGLINHWAKDAKAAFKQINARAETLGKRAAFREAFAKRRCVVLADGFYEWRRKGEPIWFHPSDGQLMLFAGLYEGWRDPLSGQLRRTFSIITTQPNELVAPVHDRMPAILQGAALKTWLAPDTTAETLAGLLGPIAAAGLEASQASPRVGKVSHDDPQLLDADDPRGARQLSLF